MNLQLDYVTGVPSAEAVPTINATHAALLYEAAAELLYAGDQAAVLGSAVRHAARMLDTHIAFVMLLDASGKVLKLEASRGHRTPTFTTIVRPVQAITAVGTGKPVQSSDFLNDSRLDHDPGTDDIVRKEGMRTVLAVPLQHRDRMLGALYAGHREPRHFPPNEVESFLALANHVSVALVRVQQLAELSAQVEFLSIGLRRAEQKLTAIIAGQHVTDAVLARINEQEGVAGSAVALADVLGRPILVTDWKLAPVAQAAASRSHVGVLNRAESREAVALATESRRAVSAGRDWKVAPITAGRNLLGYLWIGPEYRPDGGASLDQVIERLTPILAVALVTKGDADRSQRGDFIYELLAERQPDVAVLEARAATFWSHFDRPHRPMVLRILGSDEHWGSRLETARRLLSAARPHDFVAVYGRHLVVLTAPADRDHVESALADITQVFERNRIAVAAVVGRECHELRSSRDATLAALRLDDLLGGGGRIWVEGLEALAFLFDADQKDRLEALCRAALAPFGRRDRLMDAVHAYYEAGGNKANASRKLGIHVNTLRQRIDRVEHILGGSVDDSVRAVPLRLALLVRAVSRNQ